MSAESGPGGASAAGGSSPAPRQASLRRLQAFAVRPNRELWQNFLIDDNILRLIGEAEIGRAHV